MEEALLLSLAILVTCAAVVVPLILRVRALGRFVDRLILDLVRQRVETVRLETRCGSLRETVSDYVAHFRNHSLEPFPGEPASSEEGPPGLRRPPTQPQDP